jgi:hypothetical protein
VIKKEQRQIISSTQKQEGEGEAERENFTVYVEFLQNACKENIGDRTYCICLLLVWL